MLLESGAGIIVTCREIQEWARSDQTIQKVIFRGRAVQKSSSLPVSKSTALWPAVFFLEGRNKNYCLFLKGEGGKKDAVAVFDWMIYSSIENQQHEIS
jgi:hypothetical protein